jgi:hypothetical protein
VTLKCHIVNQRTGRVSGSDKVPATGIPKLSVSLSLLGGGVWGRGGVWTGILSAGRDLGATSPVFVAGPLPIICANVQAKIVLQHSV